MWNMDIRLDRGIKIRLQEEEYTRFCQTGELIEDFLITPSLGFCVHLRIVAEIPCSRAVLNGTVLLELSESDSRLLIEKTHQKNGLLIDGVGLLVDMWSQEKRQKNTRQDKS